LFTDFATEIVGQPRNEFAPVFVAYLFNRRGKMDIGVPELLIILVIVIVLFGPGRFGKILGELGSGLKSFKDNLSGENDKKDAALSDNEKDKPEKQE
jgi:sec-independent protein translocase protein TatA